jgi:hypothetical protein
MAEKFWTILECDDEAANIWLLRYSEISSMTKLKEARQIPYKK